MAPTDRETKGEFCARIMTLISYRSDRATVQRLEIHRSVGRQADGIGRHTGWRAGEVCSCSWETSRGVRNEA